MAPGVNKISGSQTRKTKKHTRVIFHPCATGWSFLMLACGCNRWYNHSCQILCWSFQGFQSLDTPNFPILYRPYNSVSTAMLHCDYHSLHSCTRPRCNKKQFKPFHASRHPYLTHHCPPQFPQLVVLVTRQTFHLPLWNIKVFTSCIHLNRSLNTQFTPQRNLQCNSARRHSEWAGLLISVLLVKVTLYWRYFCSIAIGIADTYTKK